MTRFLPTIVALLLLTMTAAAQDVADLSPRDGWAVARTPHDFDTLVARTRDAVMAHGLAVVTQAGPTGAAAGRGIAIPGNRVIGAFNNDVAVRLLRLSTAAMIHAPMRLYVTENTDGTATLSYIRPSHLLAPYREEAGAELVAITDELDATFAAIAAEAAAR